MIRVTVEVVNGDVRRRVAVQAESILRALEMTVGRNPGCEVGVAFPIDPDSFFVGDPGAEPGQAERVEAA
jgi:hypothetical protein